MTTEEIEKAAEEHANQMAGPKDMMISETIGFWEAAKEDFITGAKHGYNKAIDEAAELIHDLAAYDASYLTEQLEKLKL